MKRLFTKERVISSISVLFLFLIAIICFDITYVLNDDMMIESVLSGSFSGNSSALSYYLSVPLGFVLMLFYKLIPRVNWYGVFCVCSILVCAYLIFKRILEIKSDKKSRIYFLIIAIAGFLALFMQTLILPHYTVIAAIYGGTGLFLFGTGVISEDESVIKKNTVVIVCLIFSFLVRSKVFFMMLPFFVTIFIFNICKNGIKEIIKLVRKYLGFLLVFVIAFIIMFAINKIPYMKGEYRQYEEFNEDRTALYDYVGVREDENALNYYHENGITDTNYELYKSYNIMLSGSEKYTDIKSMGKYDDGKNTTMEKVKNAAYQYKESIFSKSDYFPYNYMIIGLYIVAVFIILKYKKYAQFISLACLIASRNVLWMYLFYNGRFPERVTFSLMLIEILSLLSIIADISRNAKNYSLAKLLPMFSMLILLGGAYYSLEDLSDGYEKQTSINESEDVVYSYMYDHQENFYFVDVYATVNHTEKLFKGYDNSFENYLVLGGWICGHPIVDKKLENVNLSLNVSTDLFDEHSYLIIKSTAGWQREDYEKYLECSMELTDTITTNINDEFYVYKCCK